MPTPRPTAPTAARPPASACAAPAPCSRRQRLLFLLAVALVALVPAPTAAQQVLVPAGASWRYRDAGSAPGPQWTSPGFDDSGWQAGPAKLGYGDGDVVTEISYGPFSFFKYTSAYFRHHFSVADPSGLASLQIRLARDDGAAVYLNGVEVARSNLPGGTLTFGDLASDDVSGDDEATWHTLAAAPSLLLSGPNVLAVEVHQSSPFSSDLGFNLELLGLTDVQVSRGPYLQRGTPHAITVRWRTDLPTDSTVRYGTSASSLDGSAHHPAFTTEHEVTLPGLQPDTRYVYAIGHGGGSAGSEADAPASGAAAPGDFYSLAGGDDSHSFVTSPLPGSASPLRVWVVGDSGTANADAAAVRDAYLAFTGNQRTDAWLMLGDNAYDTGTDAEYQAAVFDMFPGILRQAVLWPTRGNHEIDGGAYVGAFTLPAAGEAGGLPSGTEQYYAFDLGNVHFVCLNSYELLDASVGGPMWTWLAADLAATDNEWLVAYWHHPPYSKGSHDSDTSLKMTQMRVNFLPLLESAGVDLVLTGHSHSYERSYLIDGHYGFSSQFTEGHKQDGGDGRPGGDGAYVKQAASHSGAVYCVAGCSGKTTSASLDHPAMLHSVATLGSVVLDFDGTRLDATFLDSSGQTEDHFRIEHAALCQDDLGLGGPGQVELSLCGDDLTQPGSAATLRLDGAPTAAPTWLLLGAVLAPVPVAGGTLAPFPLDEVFFTFADSDGRLVVPVSGGPTSVQTLYLQGAVDAGTEIQFSNALRVVLGLP